MLLPHRWVLLLRLLLAMGVQVPLLRRAAELGPTVEDIGDPCEEGLWDMLPQVRAEGSELGRWGGGGCCGKGWGEELSGMYVCVCV